MTVFSDPAPKAPAIERVRESTREAHRRLEHRLDALTQLTDPQRRPQLIARYAALYLPAEPALAAELGDMLDLDFRARSRAALFADRIGSERLPAFPSPASPAEALGLLYVLEGSTLGGRLILRTLAQRGVVDPRLTFLDPYGAETAARWRSFLSVLARETGTDAAVEDAERGAVRGFAHAETILCGSAA